MESATECLPAKNNRVESRETAWTVGPQSTATAEGAAAPRIPTGCHCRSIPSACARQRLKSSPRQTQAESIAFATVSAERLKCNLVVAFGFGLSEHCFSVVPLVETSASFHGFIVSRCLLYKSLTACTIISVLISFLLKTKPANV